MKTNFLIALLLLASLNGLAQNTYVPDDNFEQALVVLGMDELPLDNFVKTTKIQGLTYLDVSSLNIKDLTGIEDFTSLTTFYCTNNSLKNLDVSKNILLTELNCARNELTSLDLSKNIALTSLGCSENKITNLDLSNQPNLNILECSFNSINNLDVTLNLELETLECKSNQLKNLNVDKNTALSVLYCDDNLLESLNLNENNSLKVFTCNNNFLTAIDLSQNVLLNWLRVENNKLSFLDLRNGNNTLIQGFNSINNPNLTCIYVDDPDYSTANWTKIDSSSSFKTSSSECGDLECVIPEVTLLDDVVSCENYELDNLEFGNYFTESNGKGIALYTGDVINESQDIYIYSNDPHLPDCSNESLFNIVILDAPTVPAVEDVSTCDVFILEPIDTGKYFSEPEGNGTTFEPGDEITTSQTIYIYAPNSDNEHCIAEASFNITIHDGFDFELTQSNILINGNGITVHISDKGSKYEYAIDDNSQYQSNAAFFDLIAGEHLLFVRDKNGCVEKFVSFSVYKDFYIPRFFTPNNDGTNDYWVINDNENLVKNISVFDRFGRTMAHFLPNTQGWNGFFNGNPVLSTDYWYLIKLNSGDELKGSFSLKR